jgi:NAD(P)-dependent dehydrogenase (short-subunit alcohol dehydrogenase family)
MQTRRRGRWRENQKCLLIPGDVRDAHFCDQAVDQVVETFGRLDILVNNAVYQQSRTRLEEITEDQWDTTFRTNVYGYFFMAKAALRHLKPGGVIINTGSITGLEGSTTLLDYAASKVLVSHF